MDLSYRIVEVERARTSAGKRHLLRHLHGERITQRQAILAKCCDCMGYHADGRLDCRVTQCPLYCYMPYRGEGEKQAVKSRRRSPGSVSGEGTWVADLPGVGAASFPPVSS